MAGNLASGGAAGATSLLFVYSLDYARTRLAADNKGTAKGGERQFNGLVDVYKKTLASDGIAGLYRGFIPSVVGIIVYRGLYFGMYDSLKPVVMTGPLQGSFLASFLLGWGVTTGAGIASYPLDTIRRRMMMTSGEKVHYSSMMDAGRQIVKAEGVSSLCVPSESSSDLLHVADEICCSCSCPANSPSTAPRFAALLASATAASRPTRTGPPCPPARGHLLTASRVLVRTSSVVSPVPVSCRCTTSCRSLSSARSTRAARAKQLLPSLPFLLSHCFSSPLLHASLPCCYAPPAFSRVSGSSVPLATRTTKRVAFHTVRLGERPCEIIGDPVPRCWRSATIIDEQWTFSPVSSSCDDGSRRTNHGPLPLLWGTSAAGASIM